MEKSNVSSFGRGAAKYVRILERADECVGYCVSKTALNGVTVQLASALPRLTVHSDGQEWVRTEMGGDDAARILWRRTEGPQDLTGKFVNDRGVIPW
ncbi:MAG: hypothetical protein M3505_12565 [Verrucomicrobiota bacterium]|nr:hypothetical protein [Chthoniobacterales bacterium]MDQ3315432.1 hypothetical protein [Verrucomicrobiota bacterium]